MSTNQPTAAQPIDLEPAARVDRIISASGLAEVSVFLESALKVGTKLYAAPANQSAVPAAPHAQAEPVYQMRSLTEPGGWLDTDADGPTSIKRMPHWAPVYEFRTLCAALVPQEAEQAGDIELIRIPAHDADSYCRILSIIGMEEEGDPVAEVQRLFDAAQEAEQAATAAVTAPAGVTLKAIRAHGSKEWFICIEHPFGTSYVRMSDRRDLQQLAELIACQPAAPAVTDAARSSPEIPDSSISAQAARDVLADAKGGAA